MLKRLACQGMRCLAGWHHATLRLWVQAFYYFPVERIIQHRFFANPEWTALRGRDRDGDMQDNSTYLGSRDAQRIDQHTAGKLFHRDSGLLELGYDHLQCFNFVTYSIGMVNIRRASSPQLKALPATSAHVAHNADS